MVIRFASFWSAMFIAALVSFPAIILLEKAELQGLINPPDWLAVLAAFVIIGGFFAIWRQMEAFLHTHYARSSKTNSLKQRVVPKL